MRLLDYPGSCSIGIHALLEEIGEPYEIQTVDLASLEQHSPDFRAVNPKGKVPALIRDDGTVLTEFPAIALWLAKTFPQACLIGPSIEDEARAIELLDYIVGSVHMRGITLVIMPMKFLPNNPAAQVELRQFGRAEVSRGLEALSAMLGGKPYFLGKFSIVDAAFFYMLRMAIEFDFHPPANLLACFDRICARPGFLAALSRVQEMRSK